MAPLLVQILAASILLQLTSQQNYGDLNGARRHSLTFLTFLPCGDPGQLMMVDHDDLASGQCDVLANMAVNVAVNRINRSTMSSVKLELMPAININKMTDSVEWYRYITRQFSDGSRRFHGIIGPDNNTVATDISYMYGRQLDILQISYSVTKPTLSNPSKYPRFYATPPTDLFLNEVRQEMLIYFKWKYNIVTFSSDNPYHIYLVEHLSSLLHNNTDITMSTVHHLGSDFHSSFEVFAKFSKGNETRIFLPIVDEKYLRDMFCIAYKNELTTAEHVWILGGVYNSKWWYSNDSTSSCTNNEILQAINSTLFVDVMPFDLEKRKDISQILFEIYNQKFEDLDYPSNVLHSRMFHAYDAVNIQALLWNITINELMMSNNLNNMSLSDILQDPWKSISLAQFLNDTLEDMISPYNGLAGQLIFNSSHNKSLFGSSIITQMIGEKESIVATYIKETICKPGDVCGSFDLCNDSLKGCGLSWKGGFQPNDGGVIINVDFIATFVILNMLYLVGIVTCIVFIIITIVWRNKKYIKSTTPLFTIILNVTCVTWILSYYVYLGIGYIILYQKDTSNPAMSYLCSIHFSMQEMSHSVIFATVIVKNWRVYRIFNNPKIATRKYLSNWFLSLIIVVITIPGVVLSLLMTVIYRTWANNSISQCTEANIPEPLRIIIIIYFCLLLIGLTVLGIRNMTITSFFKMEGELATLVAICTGIIGITVHVMHSVHISTVDSFYVIIYLSSLMILVIIGLINIPKFCIMFRNKRKKVKIQSRIKISDEYLQKINEINQLKDRMAEVNKRIHALSLQTID
jgi:gamma-aminobutyric acid type B receptor